MSRQGDIGWGPRRGSAPRRPKAVCWEFRIRQAVDQETLGIP